MAEHLRRHLVEQRPGASGLASGAHLSGLSHLWTPWQWEPEGTLSPYPATPCGEGSQGHEHLPGCQGPRNRKEATVAGLSTMTASASSPSLLPRLRDLPLPSRAFVSSPCEVPSIITTPASDTVTLLWCVCFYHSQPQLLIHSLPLPVVPALLSS